MFLSAWNCIGFNINRLFINFNDILQTYYNKNLMGCNFR